MKTVEEQHADYQKHISVLKESLIAKEEHYNMLQLDVSFAFFRQGLIVLRLWLFRKIVVQVKSFIIMIDQNVNSLMKKQDHFK